MTTPSRRPSSPPPSRQSPRSRPAWSRYLARWRMTLAAQCLRDDDAVIADVAEAVGYANPVAFSKAFARLQGVGPATFRRAERPIRQ